MGDDLFCRDGGEELSGEGNLIRFEIHRGVNKSRDEDSSVLDR